MMEILERSEGNVIGIRANGKLTEADYHQVVPYLERMIEQHHAIRILFDAEDMQGWAPGALWEDLRFDLRHNAHIERAAMVGDKEWEKWLTNLAKPLAHGDVRYFDRSDLQKAWTWILEDAPTPTP